MTTSELIKMLRKADPEGDAHVRVNGECPTFVEMKPGYWDGSYSYIEDGEFHISDKGVKVDIHTMDLEWWLMDNDANSVKTHLRESAQNNHEVKLAKLLLELE